MLHLIWHADGTDLLAQNAYVTDFFIEDNSEYVIVEF